VWGGGDGLAGENVTTVCGGCGGFAFGGCGCGV
jgi:hypothetical protein